MDYWVRRPCSHAYHTNSTCEQANYGRMVDQPYNCTSKNLPQTCALIDPNWDLTEEFGVVVGHTLVDATTPSASVLIINPNAEEVVLPCGLHIGGLVLSVSVAPVESTTTNKDDDGTSRLLGGHYQGVTCFLGRYRSSIFTQFAPPI